MRDPRFTILKALAIMLVVLSHAGVAGWLNHFLFIVHVPAFFLCAGWFFHTRHLAEPAAFVAGRVRRLYVPFVKWSLFFLVVHNLLFPLGLLSETYGNATGGVTHPYTWTQTAQHAWDIVFGLRGYDPFICGTFWFFRTLLLSSVAFLVLFKLLRRSSRFADDKAAGWGMLCVSAALALWMALGGLTVPGVAQGGYRELTALTLMSAGFLLRQYGLAERLSVRIVLPCLAFFVAAGLWFPSCMDYKADALRFVELVPAAVAGFVLLLFLSSKLAQLGGAVKKGLLYIGDHTLHIFAFHFLAFKAVSALRVASLPLPWEAVGSHPVIHGQGGDALWAAAYFAAGVALPLAWLAAWRALSDRVSITWKAAGGYALAFAVVAARFAGLGLRAAVRGFLAGMRGAWRGMVSFYRSFVQGVKDVIDASSTKEE